MRRAKISYGSMHACVVDLHLNDLTSSWKFNCVEFGETGPFVFAIRHITLGKPSVSEAD
jgi:hypothetical protein